MRSREVLQGKLGLGAGWTGFGVQKRQSRFNDFSHLCQFLKLSEPQALLGNALVVKVACAIKHLPGT